MSAVNTLTCAQCAAPFPAPPFRRGKVQTYCSRPCQITAANTRRSIKRRGSAAQRPCDLSTAGKTPERPLYSTPTNIPPDQKTPASDPPRVVPSVDRAVASARIKALMTLAHSRGGIDPWQVAELARLRGISPWAPLRVIIGQGAPAREKDC